LPRENPPVFASAPSRVSSTLELTTITGQATTDRYRFMS
jgi:hypothetical protein